MKTFDPIDILFILLISCYLICFVIIVVYIIRNKKIDLKDFTKEKEEIKVIPKKKKTNNSRKTSVPQRTKKTVKKDIRKSKRSGNGKKTKKGTTKKRKAKK